MNKLSALFEKLSMVEDSNIVALPIPDFESHRLGKDSQGRPCLLLSFTKGDKANLPSIKLKNLAILFQAKCKITIEQKNEEGFYTLIQFTNENEDLQNYFLQLCSMLLSIVGQNPTLNTIQKEVYFLIELLKNLEEVPIKSVQGLWGELFIIEQAKDIETMIDAWHNEIEEKYDFSFKNKQLEVKTSASKQRIHHFSLEQLNPIDSKETFIASLFVQTKTNGTTIGNLIENIFAKIPNRIDLQTKIQKITSITLGNSIIDAFKISFDYSLAQKSLIFYRAEDIPKIKTENIPKEITNVKFQVDLSEVKASKFYVQD